MRITVLGATGRTGRLFTDQAIAAGHHVVAYARHPETLQHRPGLEVLGGELADVDALTRALTGSDALVSTLGPAWITRVTLMQAALPNAILAMKRAGVRRIVVQSAFGVGDTARKAGLIARLGYATVARSVFADHHKAESQLPASGLDWTTVHPVILTNGPRSARPTVKEMTQVDTVPGLPRVSRADVAAVLLTCLTDPATIGHQIFVA